jgi:hypothetical protein
VAPESQSNLEQALAKAFELWRLGSLSDVRADLGSLRGFDRRILTGELGRLFDGTMPAGEAQGNGIAVRKAGVRGAD